MTEKLSIARLKKFGETFEISVDSDKALLFKKGELSDVADVLLVDGVFTDLKKGLLASQESLQKVFQTTDPLKIALIILKEGEIQLTAEHRAEEREKRWRKLIGLIHRQAIDPRTGLPHPATRIEAALADAKIHLDDHKTVEEQFDQIISALRPILPIKIEQKKLRVVVPAAYAGKSYQPITSSSKVLRESWKNDGSWEVIVEIPAGLYQEYIDKLNALTHGEVDIVEEKA